MKKSSPNYGKSPKIAKFSAGVAQTATCLLCHFLVALTVLKVAQIETSSPIWQHWLKDNNVQKTKICDWLMKTTNQIAEN